jgi:hypothetical protein
VRRQQGIEESIDIRTQREASDASVAVEADRNAVVAGQSIAVRKNSGGAESVRPRLNLIEGANITITLVDDGVNDEMDITIAATQPVLNKFNATVAPGLTDDSAHGYSVGSQWVDNTFDDAYICVDATVNSAAWKKTTP